MKRPDTQREAGLRSRGGRGKPTRGTAPETLDTIVVGGNAGYLRAVLRLLRTHPCIAVAGSAGSAVEAEALLERCTPRLALIDVRLPDCSGFELARTVRQKHAGAKIVLIAAEDDEEYRNAAARAGADGLACRDDLAQQLPVWIRDFFGAPGPRQPRRGAQETPMPRTASNADEKAWNRFRSTFNQAAVGIIHSTTEGRILEANRSLCVMLGYSSTELHALNTRDLTHPDDRDRQDAQRLELVGGLRSSFSSEKRYVRKDGRVIWINRTVALGHETPGADPYLIQTIEDITERKALEQRFQNTFNQAAVGIVHTALDGAYLMVNRKFCEMTGYEEGELIGRTADILTHPADLEESRSNREQLRQGKLSTHKGEKRYIRKDGKVIWVMRTASMAYDESGKPIYAIRVIEDITERKEAEERYRATFDSAPVGIMHTRIEDDSILRANPRLCEMLGYARDELVGMTTDDMIPAGLRGVERGKYRDRMLTGELKTFSSERQLIRKDGSAIWVNRTVSLARDSSGRPLYFIRIIEDISERKRLEHRFRDTFEQAAVGISHTGLDGRYLRVNRKLCDITGYTEEELTCPSSPRMSHPDDVESGGVERKRLMSGEIASHNNEKRYVRKDGTVIWVTRTESLARDEAGDPLYLIRVIEDISERKRAQETAARERVLLRTVVDALPERIYAKDREGRFLLQNAVNVRAHGAGSHEELLGKTVFDIFPREVAERVEAEDRGIIESGKPLVDRERVSTDSSGNKSWVVSSKVPLRDTAGNVFGLVGVNRDITKRKQAEAALRESEQQFRQLADNIPQVFWITDLEQKQLIYVSPAFEEISGLPIERVRADPRSWLDAVHADDRERVGTARRGAVDGSYDETFRLVRPDGTIRWIHERAFPVADETGTVYRIAGIAEDVTGRKLAEEQLMNLAHYDVLTGLPNRVLFYDRLKQSLAHAKRNQWNVGVMFIDVDRFKNVNDTLGHAVGDKLLQQVSQRLTAAVRADDTVGRLGGDEFAIVLSHLATAQDASLVAQKLMASFNEPFKLGGAELYVTASIGITLYPDDSLDRDTLIKDADAAMYRAKELGRNGYQFYTPEMNARAQALLSMESSLRRALERNEFLLHFQPKASAATGEITGVEALLRWQSPERGLVSPAEFIPFLEETGLIVPVGEWVIKTACAQILAWQRAGIEPVPVAVNLSARQFQSSKLGASIVSMIEESGIEPRFLELELTESSLMQNAEEAISTLQYLKSCGMNVSIDDFGTGYSSLAYLKRFPLDALKIDRSFVRDITSDPDDATITRAVISMAHSLGLKVIAEGVETEAQLEFLAEYGCDEIQGYFFSRPLTAEACGTWLGEKRRLQRLPQPVESAPTVLLVDDDDDTLTLLKRSLAKDGYQLLTARNAHEALDVLSKNRVDLVISDQHMPGVQGVEFLQRVKRLHPKTVRLMTSGDADVQIVTDAINKSEVFRFLPKGMNEDKLRTEVREAMQSRVRSAPESSIPPATLGK